MQIYTGYDYTYTWETKIKEMVALAKEDPLTMYYIVVSDPKYVEEVLLQYSDALFNIEVIRMSMLLKKMTSSNLSVLTTMQKLILLKQVLENNPNSLFYQTKPVFTTLEQLLSIFDTFYYGDIKTIDTHILSMLSKEKIDACFSLYLQFMQAIPSDHKYHLLDTVTNTMSKQVFYIQEDTILQPKYKYFIETLAKNNTVSILSNHMLNDTRALYATHQNAFKQYPTTILSNNDSYLTFLTTQVFSDANIAYQETHPFHIIKETNQEEEIKSVCFSIYQDIVEHNMSYQDFVIYYPNNQYLEIVLATLTSFHMPFSSVSMPKEYPIMQACIFLLEHIKDSTDENMIRLLDTLLLKKCSSFKQINYYKKTSLETKEITSLEYLALQTVIQEYCLSLQKATSIHDKTNILLQFLQEEIIYDDSVSIIINYLTSLLDFHESISFIDYIDLLKTTKPMNSMVQEEVIDHIYLSTYEQSYASLLPIKKIYLLGMNETIIPKTIKDEGILLDNEKSILQLYPCIRDTLSLQQNQFLKILTNHASSIVLSYAMISNANDTLLPSSYVLHLEDLFNIPTIDTKDFYNHPATAHRLYQLGSKDTSYQTLNATIDNYTKLRNQPLLLSILPYKDTMSASQLETYNSCPYLYFCQYGLELQPFNTISLQANEIGSMVHYILETSTSFFNDPKIIDIDQITSHVYKSSNRYLSEHEEIKRKMKQPNNHFFITCIKEDLVNTILILMQQMAVSSFHVVSTEERFKTMYHEIPIKGFVDRIDTFSNYMKVIDYKSSNKELDLTLAVQGFNMQMLLYLDILSQSKQLNKGAVLYFNTKKRILKSKTSILETEMSNNFFKEYKMEGYVMEDVIEEIDNSIDETSSIIKVKYVKKDNAYKGNILSTTSLEDILGEVEQYTTYLYQQILTGNISIAPKASNIPTIHTKVHPCRYCNYRSICNFDVFYNDYDFVQLLDAEGDEDDDFLTTFE